MTKRRTLDSKQDAAQYTRAQPNAFFTYDFTVYTFQ